MNLTRYKGFPFNYNSESFGMLPLTQIVFSSLPSRIVNILISPGGDGSLLSQLNDISLSGTIHKDFTFSSFALISSQLLMSNLVCSYFPLVELCDSDRLNKVRYLLGHVVAISLILEIARRDRAFSDQERGHNKWPLTFRSIYKSIRQIYDTQSLYTFSRALVIGLVYQVTHYAIRACLEIAIFRHELLKPLVYVCSSVLLCKLHLIWTCATISAHSLRLLSLTENADQRKWTHLAVPSFTYGICQALMYEAQSLIQGSMISPGEGMSISTRAGAETFAVIIMLAFRLIGLLPASITLILTEASLLPGKLETIIPSPAKNRGSTIAELRGGDKIPPGLAAFTSSLKAFGVPQFLWLIELHLKKCFVQIAIELLTLPIIIFSIL